MPRKVIGVDFGSSQSSISVMTIGTMNFPELLYVAGYKGGITVPTILALDKNDNSFLAFGNEVYNYKKGNTGDFEFVSDFKRKLDCGKEYDQYCQIYINELANLVKNHYNISSLDADEYVTCFAYPASWEGTDKVNKLKVLAEKAGFPDVKCISEPVAAMNTLRVINDFKFSDKPEYHMVIDFGGGTLDICIIRTDILGKDPKIIAKSGDPKLGGKEFDDIIEKLFFRNNDTLNQKDFKEKNSSDLHKQIKEAKNFFSEIWLKRDSATYDFNLRGCNKLTLSKEEFKEICKTRGIFDQITKCIKEALNQSELRDTDIKKVILTGGSSKWFFMPQIVAEKFALAGEKIYLTQNPFTDVANGCAIERGWSPKPLKNPGLWIKYKIDNKQESEAIPIIKPSSTKNNEQINVPITELEGTKYFSNYQISIIFLKLTGEKSYESIGETAIVEFPAKSNKPFIKRLTRIIDAVKGNKLSQLTDKYYLYFIAKERISEYSNNCHYYLLLLDDNEYKWVQAYYKEGIDSANKLPRGKRLEAPIIGGFKCKFNIWGKAQLIKMN